MKEFGSGGSAMVYAATRQSELVFYFKPTCGKCLQDNFRVTYVKCLACVKLTS